MQVLDIATKETLIDFKYCRVRVSNLFIAHLMPNVVKCSFAKDCCQLITPRVENFLTRMKMLKDSDLVSKTLSLANALHSIYSYIYHGSWQPIMRLTEYGAYLFILRV